MDQAEHHEQGDDEQEQEKFPGVLLDPVPSPDASDDREDYDSSHKSLKQVLETDSVHAAGSLVGQHSHGVTSSRCLLNTKLAKSHSTSRSSLDEVLSEREDENMRLTSN